MCPVTFDDVPDDDFEDDREVTQDELEDDCYLEFIPEPKDEELLKEEELVEEITHEISDSLQDHVLLLGGPYDGFYMKPCEGNVDKITIVINKNFDQFTGVTLNGRATTEKAWYSGDGVDTSENEKKELKYIKERKAVYLINLPVHPFLQFSSNGLPLSDINRSAVDTSPHFLHAYVYVGIYFTFSEMEPA